MLFQMISHEHSDVQCMHASLCCATWPAGTQTRCFEDQCACDRPESTKHNTVLAEHKVRSFPHLCVLTCVYSES